MSARLLFVALMPPPSPYRLPDSYDGPAGPFFVAGFPTSAFCRLLDTEDTRVLLYAEANHLGPTPRVGVRCEFYLGRGFGWSIALEGRPIRLAAPISLVWFGDPGRREYVNLRNGFDLLSRKWENEMRLTPWPLD